MSKHDDDEYLGVEAGSDAGDWRDRLADDDPPDEQTLIDAARAGDNDAFATLWEMHREAALRYAVSLGTASPDDVVSEASVRVLTAVRSGAGPTTSFEGYWITAVRNLVHERATHRSELSWDADVELSAVASDDVEADALGAIDAGLIEQVFAAMPEREARLLRAVAKNGVPVGVAAKAEGMTSNHASVVLKRARKSFQKIWIQNHTEISPNASAECKWVLEHAGAYTAGTLKAPQLARVKTHLKECDGCAVAIEDARRISHTWGKALGGAAGLLPGGFATTAWGATALPALVTAGGTVAVAVAVIAGITMFDDNTPAPPPVVSISPTASPSPLPTPTPEQTPLDEPLSPAPTNAAPATSPAAPRSSAPTPAGPSSTVVPWANLTASADNGPSGLCYPSLSGSGEPGQALLVSGIGWQVRTVIDADGHWQTARLDGLTQGTVIYNVSYSAADAGAAPLHGSLNVTQPPSLMMTTAADSIIIQADGQAGQPVEVLLDGQLLASANLDANGIWRATFPALAPGAHTLAVRYAPPGCTGPSLTLPVSG